MNIRAILLGTAAIALLASPAAAAAAKSNANDQRLDQLEQMVREQNSEIQELKAGQTANAQSGQDDAAVSAQVDALQNQVYENSAATKSAWWQNTKVSGRMYYDITSLEHKSKNGSGVAVNQADKGIGFDIKRFYVGIDHKFDDMFSANITTDFQYDSGAGATQIYIKKAYLEAKISDAAVFRLGSTDLPWVPFVEDLYGYRYVENIMIDRDKIGTSADWGAHFSGKLNNGMFNYALSVIDGAGYKKPGTAGRTKSVDFEGRANLNYQGFILGVGGYSGKLGKNVQSTAIPAVPATHHTAQRFDAVAAYTDDQLRVGLEYFSAKNWFNVTSPDNVTDKDSGVSAFASYMFDPQWGVFGRYDMVNIKTTTTHSPAPSTFVKPKDGYYNFGITWSPAKIVDFSLVYKHDRVSNGSISTSNGTIGGSAPGESGTYNEIGLWGQFRW